MEIALPYPVEKEPAQGRIWQGLFRKIPVRVFIGSRTGKDSRLNLLLCISRPVTNKNKREGSEVRKTRGNTKTDSSLAYF